jgi:uncharacterized protein (TIGR01244 family)
MRRMTTTIRSAAGLLLLGASVVAAGIPETMAPAAVPGYRRLRPELATAGQPSPEALARLKAQGFRTVINLRGESEGAREEEKAIIAHGLRYVWIPVSPDTFSLEDVAKVKAVLDDRAAAPVLLHCSSANRVGAVWMAMRVREGIPLEQAEKEGSDIGLTSAPMRAAVRRVLGLSVEPPAR